MKLSLKAGLISAAMIQLLVLTCLVGVASYFLNALRQADQAMEQARQAQSSLQQTLRGVGEVLLTEGNSSSSRKTAVDGAAAFDAELQRLKKSADHAGGALAQGVNEWLLPRWAPIKAVVEATLARKKLSVDDVDTMVQFGKLITAATELSAKVDGVIALADLALAAAVRTFAIVVGLGLLALVLVVAVASWSTLRAVTRPLAQAIAVAERIAAGDLSNDIRVECGHEMGQLMSALAHMQTALRRTVQSIRSAADEIGTASSEIEAGNHDLSSRTEQQAGSLQSTASSIEQLTATVQGAASIARDTNVRMRGASGAATRGGEAVDLVVQTMGRIDSSSKKIAEIISVIDGIAFQTNILALNAAVEAARAGEQGRGFAVVASEVRSLAHRSAGAAREIKGLIAASVSCVEAGNEQVASAGRAMAEILDSVQSITDSIARIHTAADEQAIGIEQVNGSVSQIEGMTQQNAAMVEQSAKVAQSLNQQTHNLIAAIRYFTLAQGASTS